MRQILFISFVVLLPGQYGCADERLFPEPLEFTYSLADFPEFDTDSLVPTELIAHSGFWMPALEFYLELEIINGVENEIISAQHSFELYYEVDRGNLYGHIWYTDPPRESCAIHWITSTANHFSSETTTHRCWERSANLYRDGEDLVSHRFYRHIKRNEEGTIEEYLSAAVSRWTPYEGPWLPEHWPGDACELVSMP